ncbi:MAG TPA: fumarylacetoacetate hydrolase family protein, partial [Pirellulales bacterium]|nr:fumarylacetoacetate hydrolase family protein [Pirellulales bacterium]
MKLCRYRSQAGKDGVGIVDGGRVTPLLLTGSHYTSLADIFESDDPAATARLLIDPKSQPLAIESITLLPPVDQQEVWAAGVTYKRSRAARMEESEIAADVYQRVYDAPRPELFFKCMPYRVVGHERPVRIRSDGVWNVPEPELVLVLNSRMQLVGSTIGNDMSCRDIEGDNPLYLPQAKIYDQSCALGPWITLASAMPPRNAIGIRMAIVRSGAIVFEGATSTA